MSCTLSTMSLRRVGDVPGRGTVGTYSQSVLSTFAVAFFFILNNMFLAIQRISQKFLFLSNQSADSIIIRYRKSNDHEVVTIHYRRSLACHRYYCI